MITQKYLDGLTYEMVGSTIEVHKFMGRGLLESVYHQCLIEELKHRKINFLTEMKVPVIYKGKSLDINFRCDLCLVVDIKSVIDIHKITEAQLLNYMNLLKAPKGILINFNCRNIFNEGQKTYVNEYFKKLSKH